MYAINHQASPVVGVLASTSAFGQPGPQEDKLFCLRYAVLFEKETSCRCGFSSGPKR